MHKIAPFVITWHWNNIYISLILKQKYIFNNNSHTQFVINKIYRIAVLGQLLIATTFFLADIGKSK